MAKRQRDPKSDPTKRARIEKEIFVLKSLDLHAAAYAHLCASLLKIKAVAESPKLPDEIKHGVPRPDISDEERGLLHNVTSALYNQPQVRAAVESAVVDVCNALQVPVPEKGKGKGKKGDKKTEKAARKDPEERSTKRKTDPEETKQAEKKAKRDEAKAPVDSSSEEEEGSDDEESEFGGFSDAEADVEVEAKEENVMSRFNDRLGSSDGEEYDTANEELDPMEITDLSASEDSDDDNVSLDGSASDGNDSEAKDQDEESEDDSEEPSADASDISDSDSNSDASAVTPPPKAPKRAKSASTTLKPTQYALPTLMGGYISDSQSEASDIDVAPTRKNRRGQRARQAIAEKKFKDQAKHLAKQQQGGRDDGWDMKRGAVAAGNPWKKGVKMSFGDKSGGDKGEGDGAEGGEGWRERKAKAMRKKDDEGPLHASWEAAKKAKEVQETAKFAGTRVVFD